MTSTSGMGDNAEDVAAETDAVTTMERLVQQDRAVVLFGVALIASMTWAYTIHLASTRSDFAVPMVQPWGAMELTTMFVLGVMNLVWIAALTGIAVAEKILPGGMWLSRALGVGLIAWGVWITVMGLA